VRSVPRRAGSIWTWVGSDSESNIGTGCEMGRCGVPVLSRRENDPAGGAAAGSFLWFNLLVTVGVILRRRLEKAQARRIFDGTVGLILFGSALWLAIG